MRQPTADPFAWYDATMRGETVPNHHTDPQPGFYKIRLVKNGPWIPVAIWLESDTDDETGELTSDETIKCTINNQPHDLFDYKAKPADAWMFLKHNLISEEDYRYRIDYGRWAIEHAPDDPVANPKRPTSLAEQPSLF